MLTSILSISLGAILINNFIFSQFLGCCPFLGCSSKVDTAVGMGLAVTLLWALHPLSAGSSMSMFSCLSALRSSRL